MWLDGAYVWNKLVIKIWNQTPNFYQWRATTNTPKTKCKWNWGEKDHSCPLTIRHLKTNQCKSHVHSCSSTTPHNLKQQYHLLSPWLDKMPASNVVNQMTWSWTCLQTWNGGLLQIRHKACVTTEMLVLLQRARSHLSFGLDWNPSGKTMEWDTSNGTWFSNSTERPWSSVNFSKTTFIIKCIFIFNYRMFIMG